MHDISFNASEMKKEWTKLLEECFGFPSYFDRKPYKKELKDVKYSIKWRDKQNIQNIVFSFCSLVKEFFGWKMKAFPAKAKQQTASNIKGDEISKRPLWRFQKIQSGPLLFHYYLPL